MKRLFARSRSLPIVAALAIVAAMGSVSTAQAASAGTGGVAGTNTASVSRSAAASDTPCTFGPAQSCESTDPTVTVNTYYSGDTSACTFSWDIDWGDGTSSSDIPIDAPADGYVFTAQHTYASPGVYTIALTGEVTDGSCAETNGDDTFTLDNSLATPSGLTATAVNPNDIRLNWKYNSGGQTGFEINNGVISRYVGPGSTTYTWGGLAPGTYMCFKIRAYNNSGDSAWYPDFSPWYVCTTTPKPKPSGPNITVVSSSNWAGYGVKTKVEQMETFWYVPAAHGGGNKEVAIWGGVGGVDQKCWLLGLFDCVGYVEQTGTVSNVVNGNAEYKAWVELAPTPQVYLSQKKYPVNPGDFMAASIIVSDGQHYTTNLTDWGPRNSAHKRWSYTLSITNAGLDDTSAEAVVEKVGNDALTDFGTVQFSSVAINGYYLDHYSKVLKFVVKGKMDVGPLLDSGAAFNITFKHE